MAWGAYRAKAESQVAVGYFATWSVRKRLLLSLIPSILLILVVAGYVTNWFSARYLNQALQRTAMVQNLAQASEMERMLEFHRVSLLALSRGGVDAAHLRAAIEQWGVHHPGVVKELGFVAAATAETVLLVCAGGNVHEIKHDQFNFIRGGPVAQMIKLRGLKPGQTHLSELTEVVYPQASVPGVSGPLDYAVYRLATPVVDAEGRQRGSLVVGVSAQAVRNILSLYNSPKSPLYAFARTSENRFSYYFDDQGWILFQSENQEDPERELSAENARLGMTGDYGMLEYDKAFRPHPKHESFWHMVVDVQANRGGVEELDAPNEAAGILSPNHIVAYAPVRFRSNPDREPEVVGGVAYVDRSRLADAAEFRHLDAMVVITLSGMGLVTLVIIFISKGITRPLHDLATQIRAMFDEQKLRPVQIISGDQETDLLTRAVNRMILSIQDKQEQIRRRDEHIHKVQQREKVSFDNEIPASLGWRLVGEIPDLIGQSQPMAQLQTTIRKTAGTDADVLVMGETGTGKELTAEAIHKFSSRAEMPFISINCGGLDENLLMDTLFGHVKGAFTEARTDRKGAFLASDGGTLFLDEIGTATDRVQKALLRALSVRRIRPLGSDKEVEFNVRVVAATNVDLLELVQRGEFRDDLYYRLNVISILTPPLRQRKDDIPILANHFLKEFLAHSGRPDVGLTRGALDKLMQYDWPGNVRELRNCITRALAFAEGDALLAEDLVFDDNGAPAHGAPTADVRSQGGVQQVAATGTERSGTHLERVYMPQEDQLRQVRPQGYRHEPEPRRLSVQELDPAAERPPVQAESAVANARMQAALRLAREKGSFSRVDYQNAVGAGISQRTAQYDLQTLVKEGKLRKTGKGPATQYLLA